MTEEEDKIIKEAEEIVKEPIKDLTQEEINNEHEEEEDKVLEQSMFGTEEYEEVELG